MNCRQQKHTPGPLARISLTIYFVFVPIWQSVGYSNIIWFKHMTFKKQQVFPKCELMYLKISKCIVIHV